MLFELIHPPGPGTIVVGALSGRAELAVTGLGARDAMALIDACLSDQPELGAKPVVSAKMSVSDRDRLMAALYQETFGSDISGNTVCSACDERFDYDFDLAELTGALTPGAGQSSFDPPDDEGWYGTGNTRFRVPNGLDELAALGRDEAAAAEIIAARCAPDATSASARAEVEAAMAEVAPLIDLTLSATCPHCGHANPMAFRAERYLLATLRNQRHAVWRDVHLIASRYGWSYKEITTLPRESRQAFVAQINRDTSARTKAVAR